MDDVHPAGSVPGGDWDVARRALDVLARLCERHPRLSVTFFTTPDWRSLSPRPSPGFAARLPVVGRLVHHVPVLPAGTYRLARHPEFCGRLRAWPRGEVAVHGLHHVKRGPDPLLELDGLGEARSRAVLAAALALFEEAGFPRPRGAAPPGWSAPDPLLRAMDALGLTFFTSARDLETPPAEGALASGSGRRDLPLFAPSLVPGTRLVHVPTNFQATSTRQRAVAVVRAGGLLGIKAHLLEGLGSYRALDGLSPAYGEHLHAVLSDVEDALSDGVFWPTLSELSEAVRGAAT